MRLLVFSGLSDPKLESKLAPLISHEGVEKIFLARNKPLQGSKVSPFQASFLLKIPFLREGLKFLYGLWIVLFKKIDHIIGIYLIPHGVMAHILGKLCRVPVIQLVIGDDTDAVIKHPRLFRGILKKAWRIGVRGKNSLARLNQIVDRPQAFFVHHNVYVFPEPEGESLQKDIDLVNIGHFDTYKRVDIYIDVVSRLSGKFPAINAVMAGKDVAHRQKSCEKKVVELGLEKNFRFAGHVEDVHSLLGKSRIFILTSEAEGLPMAMVEAMSLGVPVVVPDVGDITDIAEHEHNALVVKPLDVDGFVESVNRLLVDPVLFDVLSRNARSTIEDLKQEFTLSSIKKTWEEILV
jgi:glycosyltransferase involved in cell wall biosynthesis